VLFVGAIIPRKRVLDLVHAFSLLPRSREVAELRLVGSKDHDPGYAATVEREAARAGRVRLLGEIDEASLASELANADVLVIPSSFEGYGIAATEAVYAGLPVVATRSDGLLEALSPCAEAAVFVDDGPSLSESLARVMNELATNDALRHSMHLAAARARLPRWSDAVARFASVLDPNR
jgi:glycosyltransferase involved in cell wall biosynthesis